MTEPYRECPRCGSTARLHKTGCTYRGPFPPLAQPDPAPASGDAALRDAISVLENYGDHHPWCARAGGSGEPCNCGLWDEMERLNAALTPPAEPTLDVEALAEALKAVTRENLYPSDKSGAKWRADVAAKLAREYAAILAARNEQYRETFSPDVVLAMDRVVDAARLLVAMHDHFGGSQSERELLAAALADLDKLTGDES